MAPQSEQQPAARDLAGAVRRIVFSPYVAAVIAMFCWAGSTVLVRYVRHDVPPMGLSFWRTMAGFLIVLPFVIRPLGAQIDLVRRNWKILALLALLMLVCGNAVLFLAMQYTIAINAGVINSVEPVFIIVLAWALFRDPFSRRQALGVAVSLTGVLVLFSEGSLAALARMEFNRGDILVTFAYMCWALYAVMLRKLPAGLDPRVALAVMLGFGAAFMLPIYALETVVSRPTPLSWTTVFSVGWLAIFSSVLSVLLWNYAITRLGAGRAALFIHLIPAFTVLLAIVLLDETFRQFHLTGIVLIGAGIYFSTLSRTPRKHG